MELIWSNDNKTESEKIEYWEEKWGIKFPKKYLDIVSNHDKSTLIIKKDDGELVGGLIPVPRLGCSGFTLISISQIVYSNVTAIEAKYDAFKSSIPAKIYPFAENGAGDLFLFDYRASNIEPNIAFLDHEHAITEEDLSDEDLDEKAVEEWLIQNIHFVCNSFDELLELAYPAEN